MMMKLARLIVSVVVTVVVLLAGICNAHEDPTSYFNSTDHDAYLGWLERVSYERSTFLPSPEGSSTGVALHWNITDNEIYLAVAARAIGWVAFGLAESGGMKGADAVLYMAADDALIDAHILEEKFPISDDCQSWTLHNSQTEGGFLIFEASRLLDTGDTQDRPIINDAIGGTTPTRVIAAWSDKDNLGYHGPNNRVRSSLRFYDAGSDVAIFQQTMDTQAEGFVDLVAKNHPIPPNDTEYAYFCFTYNDLVNQGMPNNTALHVIGAEPIIDSAKHVHHFVLLGSEEPASGSQKCDDHAYFDLAYGWAPGEGPLTLPEVAGAPLGVNGFKSFQLETHYNNPWLDEGVLDNSGVRLYYTSQLREHDFGMLPLGDATTSLRGSPVGGGVGYAQHSFDCPSTCSTLSLQQNVTVFIESLHMHRTGERMTNAQIRDGKVIRVGKVDYFDFDQQGSFSVQQEPFEILPGDSFKTVCQYKSNNTLFGLSSQEEMCVAFLGYYPKQLVSIAGFEFPYFCSYGVEQFPACNSEWVATDLADETELGRTFGNPPESCSVMEPTSGASPLWRHAGAMFIGVALFLSYT